MGNNEWRTEVNLPAGTTEEQAADMAAKKMEEAIDQELRRFGL